MLPRSPRMPPKDSRNVLASLIMSIFFNQHDFETETLSPRPQPHGWQEGAQPMSPKTPPRGSEAPTSSDANTNCRPWAVEND